MRQNPLHLLITVAFIATLPSLALTGCSHSPVAFAKNIHFSVNLEGTHYDEKVRKVFRAEKVKTVRVQGEAGDVNVRTAKEGVEEVEIRAVRRISGELSQEKLKALLAKSKTTAKLDGETLLVTTETPEGSLPHGVGVSVRYDITVPKRMALDLQTASGSVTAEGTQGGLKIQTGSGDVEVKRVAGVIEVETASGEQKVTEVQGRERVRLHSSSGDITAKKVTASASPLLVEIESASGSIHFAGDASDLHLKSSSGDIEAETTSTLPFNSGEVESVSGEVNLTLPRDISADLSAETTSGSISFPENSKTENGEEERSRRMTLGGGKVPLHLKTSSGDITFKTR